MLSDEFPDFLQQIAGNTDFERALGLGDEFQRRGYLQELALRFFATKNNRIHFKHDVSEFLTDYMQSVARKTVKFDEDLEKSVFERVWRVVAEAMPNGVAFQGKSEDDRSFGPFSPTLFEMVSVGIANNLESVEPLAPEAIRAKINELIKEARRQSLTGSGSNSRKKFRRRLDLATSWFKGNE